MDAVISSMLLVLAAEMGDKTQLLTILLVAHYRRPALVLAGMLVATVLNHLLAAWVGVELSGFLDPLWLSRAVALVFIGLGLWALIPDKAEGLPRWLERLGPLAAVIVVFFLAEMGDKTQIATVTLAARFQSVWLVMVGTTLGMLAANLPAVWLGEMLLKRMPLHVLRRVAAVMFIAFGLAALV